LQDACKGAPDNRKVCRARDAATGLLQARGFIQANHDVWISPGDFASVLGVVQTVQAEGGAGYDAVALERAAMLTLQQRGTTSDAFIAVWNLKSAYYRDNYPYGWAVLSELAIGLGGVHPGDPRYALDNQ
jgi:hypothetical protein